MDLTTGEFVLCPKGINRQVIFQVFPLERSFWLLDRDSLWGLRVEEKKNILEEGTRLSSTSTAVRVNTGEEQNKRREGRRLPHSGWSLP